MYWITFAIAEFVSLSYLLQLTIRVTDVNDNAPKFELPDYQAHNVDEDIPLGTSILKVKATDADSGTNAEIEYHVSDDHFAVDTSGVVSNNKQLDADNNNAYYEFMVTAKDKGKSIGKSSPILVVCKSFRFSGRPTYLFHHEYLSISP